jgi:hypothetical protein
LGVGLYVVGGRFFSSLGITLSIYLLVKKYCHCKHRQFAQLVDACFDRGQVLHTEGCTRVLK